MKVLVTGASSRVGESLAAAFSQGNQLVLMGRDPERLREVQSRCLQSGAVQAESKAVDISEFTQENWREYTDGVNLVIHGSFHLSQKRDDQIASSELEEVVTANLVSPLRLFLAAAEVSNQRQPLCIILISSFLARIRSPNRLTYGSLKLLQEVCLRNIERDHPDLRVLIVHVGKVIPTDRNSSKSDALAEQVVRAYKSGRTQLDHGGLGSFLVAVFYIQPVVYFAISATQRWLRKLVFRSETTDSVPKL